MMNTDVLGAQAAKMPPGAAANGGPAAAAAAAGPALAGTFAAALPPADAAARAPTASAATVGALAAAPVHARKKAGALGIDDFLTLMTAQLKNQDPTNPTDSKDFLAQLAQFSTVSGIQSMNTTLSTLADSLRSSQALSGATLVGHDVLMPASSVTYGGGGPLGGAVDVPAGASSVTVNITDAGGEVIRHIDLASASGMTNFKWDGRTDKGTPAPSGTYGIAAIATVGGSSQSADTLLTGKVASVTLDSKGAGVTLNTPQLGSVALSKVRQII